MKVVAVVGTVGLPACYGGFETLVDNLTKLSSKEIKYYVFCSAPAYRMKMKRVNNADLIYIPLKANGYQSIFYDIWSLLKCLYLKPDIVLVLGVSGCIFLPFFKIFNKARVVVNVDGLEWRRDKWSNVTKRFLKLSEKLAVKFSDIIISDNEAISEYIYTEYNKKSVTIAYGGDHIFSDNMISTDDDIDDYYFSVCRIEPENNVHIVLDAFSQCKEKLVFVGNWANSTYGIQLKENYCRYKNIVMLDPIYDKDKLFSLRLKSKGYIHGHSAGGTNPSLVEAMNSKTAIFAFECIFNRYSLDNKGEYFTCAKSLRDLIERQTVNSLLNNAQETYAIAHEKYQWLKIVKHYEELFLSEKQ